MRYFLTLLGLLLGPTLSHADVSGAGLFDAAGNPIFLTGSGGLPTDGSAVIQPISGAVTVSGSTTGDIVKFGGTNISTGTGTSGAGIPRVTVSSDSSVTANAGTNLNTSALATSANLTAGTAKAQQVDGSGNVQPSGDVLTRKIFVQPTDGVTNQAYTTSGEALSAPLDATPATQNVTARDVSSSTGTGNNGQSIVFGTPTAGSAAVFNYNSYESIKVQVTGIWTGTLVSEVSFDGGTFWYMVGVHQTGTAYTVASFTNTFGGGVNVSGTTGFRIRATAAWTGTAVVHIILTRNPNSIYIANGVSIQDSTVPTQKFGILATGEGKVSITQPIAAGTNSIGQVTANAGTNLNTSALSTSINQTNGTQKTQVVDGSGNVQPSGDTVGRKIFIATTDGTNIQTVKAASTAAASTDPAAVVVMSSNFPVLTATTGTAVSVGVASTATVASNANRAGLILVNTSTARVSCTVGTAVLNSGVSLLPGGSWTMDQYTFTTAAIACIAGAAASNVSVQEFTK